MKDLIDVTAIIPAHNAQRHLTRALRSVDGQTQRPRAIIVVDDASSDETLRCAENFVPGDPRIASTVHHFDTNCGQAAALNFAARTATTRYLSFLDSDDEWLPEKLELQLSALENSAASWVFGWAERLDERCTPTRSTGCFPARLPSALFIERAWFHRMGGFDESLRVGSVIDWASRLARFPDRCAALERIVYRRYVHGANLGLTGASKADYLHVVRAHLRRGPIP